ncbi:lysylphosphatidylglycerol synthase transmembrane domain-containing protein [Larkinella insperata]|uniref:Lysylphosphatidylglycerol synthase transmembrane domain-containing protein n=1 Tax=Larkinella insperata TaxID=332158 RepID=A0ABW3QDG3_9BACT|nr:lysylphosphatidylglycerol synthase transmembrane domain-containing protein [Larkinella insperata]
MKNILKYGISLSIAAGLLWYVFKDIDRAAMFEAFSKANYSWIIVSGLLTVVAHWSRAYRWGLLMEPVVGHRPSPFNTTVSVLTGYFANLVVPRMGEVTRCGTLNRLEGVPVNVSFGTVVAERIVDVLVLLLLLGATFLIEFSRLSTFLMDFFSTKLNVTGLRDNSWLLVLLGGCLLGFAVMVWFFYSRYKEILRQKPFYQKIEKFMAGLLDGLLSVRKLKNPGAFVFHTALIWTMYYFMSFVLIFAMPQTAGLDWRAGLTILIMGSIGMAAPVQGGAGAFNILVGAALALYGLSNQDGATLATLMLFTQWFYIVVLGALSFLVVMIKGKNPQSQTSPVSQQVVNAKP